ncbi:MAG: serine/threonine protein kinase [Actinobacteria bacterium]|nr:serine/threonine protein kinase [Actinomycetota bacterium]
MPDWEPRRRLGSGQFGEAWLVFDRAIGHDRVVKFVRPDKIHDPMHFYSEPQVLMALRHPNIVEMYDAGTMPDGRLYVAMEYLPRGSLEDEYGGSVVPVADAIGVVADASRGTEHSHSQGIVHRDIKPANILLGDSGRAKLSDFGLATRVGAAGAASPYGYVAHLAPEVLTADETSVQTDVYALGVTAYRMLNGDASLPDPAALPGSLEDAIIAGDFPDRHRFRAHVSERLRRVIRRALSVDPQRRYASAAELRHELERVTPVVSLTEIPGGAVAHWEGISADGTTWTAVISKGKAGFDFTLTKARGGAPRRVRSDCQTFGTEALARRHARNVLGRIADTGS